MIIDKIALILTIIGALNWGSIGLFSFDIVAWISGGQTALLARIIYTLVALAGISSDPKRTPPFPSVINDIRRHSRGGKGRRRSADGLFLS